MSGARTFLFTDLEGSTRTWERQPEAMARWLASHDEIVTAAIASNRGRVLKHTGDGFCAVFASASDAARAALDLQRSLSAAGAERIGPLRARAALHTGDAIERAGDYYGPTLNRCARLLDAGHGGQVLLSQATVALLGEGIDLGTGVLLTELGPHRLRDLQRPERIWQLEAPGLAAAFPPLRSLDSFLHNLPVQRSSFVGREADQRALRELLTAHRLLTVTGVGGCGKTRLALEVAAAELDRFPDGVFFVDLSVLVEPSLVGSTIAATLQVPAAPGSGDDRLVAHLCDRRALLVLDNCEHLLDGCGAVVDRLLTSCARVSVLATSREPLALEGEHIWRVPSLGLPHGDSPDDVGGAESVRLFVDRAAAVRAGFALNRDNAAAIAEISRRLDGIPLALELAAARVAHLAPREIAARLSDRFRLLTGGRRGVQRQQTLQAVLDWSHDLLSEPERVLLRRLSVFVGGWSLETAQAVCGDGLERDTVIDILGSLVDRSLVDAEDVGDHMRYGLLETVRIYAQERLLAAGEAAAVRAAHADWFLRWAETAPDLRDVAHARLFFAFPSENLVHVADLDNLRQAADWWLEQGRVDLMLRIAVATINVFHARGRLEEPDEWIAMGLDHLTELSAELRARCLTAWGLAAEIRGDFFVANERARAAIASVSEPEEAGAAYSLLVGNTIWIDPNEAEHLLEDERWVRPLGPRAGDYLLTARATLANARLDHERALALFTRVNRDITFGPQDLQMAATLLLAGRPDDADALLDRLPDLGTWFNYSQSFLRAIVASARGEPARARASLEQALVRVRRSKIPLGLADCVVGCAVLAFHAGDPQRAGELLGAVQAATGGGLRSPMSMCVFRHYRQAVREALGRDGWRAARGAGASLSLEAAVARALGEAITEQDSSGSD